MSSSKVIAQSILRFSNAEFFNGVADFSDWEFALLDEPFQGVAINAPPVIDLDSQSTLPVVMAIADTTRRQWEVCRAKNVFLLAISEESGALFIGAAYSPPEKEPLEEPCSRMDPEPQEMPPYTESAKIERVEARARLDLPWQPGSYFLAVINYDWVSNVVEVTLKGQKKPKEGTLAVIQPDPAAQVTVAVGGVQLALPSYTTTPATPLSPQQGVEFVIPAEGFTATSLPVFGAFSVKARTRYIAQSGTFQPSAGGNLPVAGVVPVTLLVFTLDGEAPMQFDWAIPVYGTAAVAVGEKLQGSFAIDALQAGGIPLSAGHYMAYIICDSMVYGPREFSI